MSNSNQQSQASSNEPTEDQLPLGMQVYYGGGNGITGNRANVFQFDLSQRSNIAGVDNLLFRAGGGTKWGTGLNQGLNLTFSFSSATSTYLAGFSPGSKLNLTTVQMNTARQVMQVYASISNLSFTEVADTSSSAGDIRWGRSADTSDVKTAYARYPSNIAPGGDIWLGMNYDSDYQNPTLGSYGYQTYLHELGHALGLVHPHEGVVSPAPGEDQLKYSVMSYRSYDGATLSFGYTNGYFPTSLMLNDIAAIQYLYGVNTSYQSGNNTYSWAANTSVFETIYDGGGNDTIDASNQTQSVLLNLNAGSWSQIGKTFWNGQTYVRDCLTIAYSTVIENATGSAYNDTLIGNAAANVLRGGAGNDTLDGGAGSDTLYGGTGDDTYVVDQSGDIVSENVNEGIDTVNASITYTLGANLENLVLTGSATINGTGNGLDNQITGNTAANIIDGGAGADTLKGMAGDDIYYVDNIGDSVFENTNEGTDTVYSSVNFTLGANIENLTLTGNASNGTGNSLNNILIGNTYANTLTGGAGNDLLDGGAGSDTLYGGTGDDTYIVDNSGDIISENFNEGTDTVNSSVSHTLSANVENLILTGNSVISGTGNSLNNQITGNSANNTLDGGAGADTLKGLAGNDTYIVDNIGDVVIENLNEGIDTVKSSISYTLGANIENLTLTGNSAINGTGNSLDNTIIGNDYDNTLVGGAGNDAMEGFGGRDILYGGEGNDSLYGDAGGDLLYGGTGNDQYYIYDASSSIIEYQNEGIDTITIASDSILSHKMADNLENFYSPLLGNNISITGNDMANSIRIGDGNNVIIGGKGDDVLSGGGGSDTYIFNRGDGSDRIQEAGKDVLSSKTDVDVLQFGSGIASDQLWFSKESFYGALAVGIIGTTDKVSIDFWYPNQQTSWSENYIEKFQTSDGKTLSLGKVDQLVNAMAAFSPPALGQTTLPSNYQQTLAPIIAAAWS